MHALCKQPAASQLFLEIVIPALIPLLPSPTTCVFDGALYRKLLSQLARLSTVKSLRLRANDWYLPRGCSYFDESCSWVWRRWSDLVLDFRIQAILKSLQSLKIGCLQHHETQALADEVAKLRLINLEIHSSPWVSDEDHQHYLIGEERYDSPLMLFFYSLARRNGPSLLPNSLPSSPETLIVRDNFHVFKESTKQI